MGSSRRLVVMVLGLTLLAACSAPLAPATDPVVTAGAQLPPVLTDDDGEVTITAQWLGPEESSVFLVKLDTHSVDLDRLDLADTLLRNDLGRTLRALPWEAAAGGHHREGRLAFEGDAERFLAGAAWIELVLFGVGPSPERVLRWELGP